MLAVLDFEATADKNLVRKEEAIREELAISPIRYYQLLNYALELPEANEKYPMLVAQLRRRRDIRDNQRRESHKY
nr:DUF3263 domain-containing protein [Corynebacterium kutscheri]